MRRTVNEKSKNQETNNKNSKHTQTKIINIGDGCGWKIFTFLQLLLLLVILGQDGHFCFQKKES